MNYRFRLIALLVSTGTLLSCSGEEQSRAQIELTQPEIFRQVLVFDPGNLMVMVSVNNGPPQTFEYGGASASVVEISGVQLDQMNDITLTWIEVVDGRNVFLSEQSQSFMADGNTTIDAAHDYTLFNDDGDEFSNFEERLLGTCVWSPFPSCDTTSVELLTDGDFSQGGVEWYSTEEDDNTLAGEYCITAPQDSYSWIAHRVPIALQGQVQYEMSFDIKADVESTARVALLDFVIDSFGDTDTFIVNVGQELPVFTTYQRRNVTIPVNEDLTRTVAITFPLDSAGRFCIDNVSLVAGPAT